MRTTVIGTGYLGAVHAACMAEIGHDVLGIDIDRDQVKALTAGRPRFFEPGQLPGSFAADISGVEAVVDELGPLLKRPCLVVGK